MVPDIISLCQSKSYSISFSVTTALLSNKHIQINICRHNNSRIFIYLFPNIHTLILHTIAITRVVHFCRRPVRWYQLSPIYRLLVVCQHHINMDQLRVNPNTGYYVQLEWDTVDFRPDILDWPDQWKAVNQWIMWQIMLLELFVYFPICIVSWGKRYFTLLCWHKFSSCKIKLNLFSILMPINVNKWNRWYIIDS